jgi:magnesium chelatase family protein
MLVASMNPCPCGYFNHPEKECNCGPSLIKRYLSRISGPLLDRIDIQIEVVPVPFHDLTHIERTVCSKDLREQVLQARKIQEIRFRDSNQVFSNSQMGTRMVKEFCSLDHTGQSIMKMAMGRLGLSARAYDRILKVARTIADLENSAEVQSRHLAEAINYRNMDREDWGG